MSDTSGDGHGDGFVPETGRALELEEALDIVGEETRAAIIAELGAATREDGVTPAVLSFSELMERVGADDSGRFNYHLGKLVDTFVKKSPEGYVLRPPGHFVYRAIVTGALADREGFEPFVVDDCPACGDDLVVQYPANQCIYVVCDACERYSSAMPFPNSGVAERSREGVLEAALRTDFHDTALLRQGVCHGCSSVVTGRLRTDVHETWDELLGYDEYVVFSCSTCNVGRVGHPAGTALTATAARAFFDDHDRDVATVAPWSDTLATARRETMVRDDGTCVVPFELDDERLTVRLDDGLQVVGAERERRPATDA